MSKASTKPNNLISLLKFEVLQQTAPEQKLSLTMQGKAYKISQIIRK